MVQVEYITRNPDWPQYDPVTDEYVALTRGGGEVRDRDWTVCAERKRRIDRYWKERERDYREEQMQARRPL